MTRLGTAITETIVLEYGASAFLSRLSDPFWFQALGAVMGMDWHSSGITTDIHDALSRGDKDHASELLMVLRHFLATHPEAQRLSHRS